MSVWTIPQAQWDSGQSSSWGDPLLYDRLKAVIYWWNSVGPFPAYARPLDTELTPYYWARYFCYGVTPRTMPTASSGGYDTYLAFDDYRNWRATGVSTLSDTGPTPPIGLIEPATFGMQFFSNASQLVYSTDDVTWNQVDFFLAPKNQTTSASYSVLTGREVLVLQMFIDPPPLEGKAIAHDITVSGTTVTASGGSENTFVLVLMR